MLRSTLVLFASAALLAQGPLPSPATAPPPPILVGAPFHGVCIDEHPSRDGRFWCRGDRYKMSFGTQGAAYVPLFSSRAPQHFPLAFHLAGATAATPERSRDGFVFRFGAVEERWALRPDGAEQSFVLAERPANDELVIEVTTALPCTGADAAGLHFRAAPWGEVVYGNAVAIAPDGARTALRTTFDAGAIHIALPQHAAYPLVVDPFVTTIGVAANEAFDNRNPDVAYDAGADRWCVAMEERVSAFDTDIKVRRFNGAGTVVDTDYFETSGDVATAPAVAAAGSGTGDTFCVAWLQNGDVIARRVGASAASAQNPRTISDHSIQGDAKQPDVGGNPLGDHLIVYTTDTALILPHLYAAKITAASSSGDVTVFLGTGTGCVTAFVSAAMAPDNHWVIAWNDQASGCLGGNVKFMAINVALGVELPPTTIAGSALDDDRHVDVAWNGSVGMVVWDRDQGNHHDIFGQAFQRTGAGYSLLGGNRNLGTLEPGITIGADQQKPAIATDGTRFVVAYMEGSTPKPICATFAIDNGVVECHEGHVPIATANVDHDDLGIAAMGTTGGALTRYFVVTDERDGSNDYDVQGLLYDGRQTGAMFTAIGTGCVPVGAAAVQLGVTGGADLGHSFQVTMTGHRALPFVVAGLPQSPSLVLCTYLAVRRCRQGVQSPFLVTTFGASLAVNVPPSVGLVGMTLAFQGLDVLASGACSANLFGAAFSVTDTIEATIR